MENKKEKPCIDHDRCIQVLNLIIDGEANADEEIFFHTHIQDCLECSQYYTIEQSIREVIKKKLEKKSAPDDLIADLRNKIRESSTLK